MSAWAGDSLTRPLSRLVSRHVILARLDALGCHAAAARDRDSPFGPRTRPYSAARPPRRSWRKANNCPPQVRNARLQRKVLAVRWRVELAARRGHSRSPSAFDASESANGERGPQLVRARPRSCAAPPHCRSSMIAGAHLTTSQPLRQRVFEARWQGDQGSFEREPGGTTQMRGRARDRSTAERRSVTEGGPSGCATLM